MMEEEDDNFDANATSSSDDMVDSSNPARGEEVVEEEEEESYNHELYSTEEEEKALSEITLFLADLERDNVGEAIRSQLKRNLETATSKLSQLFDAQRGAGSMMDMEQRQQQQKQEGSISKEALMKELNQQGDATRKQEFLKLVMLQRKNDFLTQRLMLAEQTSRNITMQWTADKEKFNQEKVTLRSEYTDMQVRLTVMEKNCRQAEQQSRGRMLDESERDVEEDKMDELGLDELRLMYKNLQDDQVERRKLLSEMALQVSDGKMQLLNAQQRIELLTSRIEELTKIEEELNSKLDNVEKQESNITSQTRKLTFDNQDLRDRLQSKTAYIDQLEDDIKAQKDDYEEKMRVLSAAANDTTVRTKLKHLEAEFLEHKKSAQSRENALDREAKFAALEKSDALKQVQLLVEALKKVAVVNIRLTDGLSGLHKHVEKKLSDFSVRQVKQKRSSDMLVAALKKIGGLKGVASMKSASAEFERDKIFAENTSGDREMEIDRLNKKMVAMQKDFKAREKQAVEDAVAEVTADLQSVQKELDIANKVIDALNEKIRGNSSQTTDAPTAGTHMELISELQMQVTKLEIEKHQLAKDLNSKVDTIEKLQSEMQQLGASFTMLNSKMQTTDSQLATVTKEKNDLLLHLKSISEAVDGHGGFGVLQQASSSTPHQPVVDTSDTLSSAAPTNEQTNIALEREAKLKSVRDELAAVKRELFGSKEASFKMEKELHVAVDELERLRADYDKLLRERISTPDNHTDNDGDGDADGIEANQDLLDIIESSVVEEEESIDTAPIQESAPSVTVSLPVDRKEAETQTAALRDIGTALISRARVEEILRDSTLTDNFFFDSNQRAFNNKYPVEDRMITDLVEAFHVLSNGVFDAMKSIGGVDESARESSFRPELTTQLLVSSVEGLLHRTARDVLIPLEKAKERVREEEQMHESAATIVKVEHVVVEKTTRTDADEQVLADRTAQLHDLQNQLRDMQREKVSLQAEVRGTWQQLEEERKKVDLLTQLSQLTTEEKTAPNDAEIGGFKDDSDFIMEDKSLSPIWSPDQSRTATPKVSRSTNTSARVAMAAAATSTHGTPTMRSATSSRERTTAAATDYSLIAKDTVLASPTEVTRKNCDFTESDGAIEILNKLNEMQKDELRLLVLDSMAEDVRRNLFQKTHSEMAAQARKAVKTPPTPADNKYGREREEIRENIKDGKMSAFGQILISDFERLHSGKFGPDDLVALTILEHRIRFGHSSTLDVDETTTSNASTVNAAEDKRRRQLRMSLRSVTIQKELLKQNVVMNFPVLDLLRFKHITEKAIVEISALSAWQRLRYYKQGGVFKDVLTLHKEVVDDCLLQAGGWTKALDDMEKVADFRIDSKEFPEYFAIRALEMERSRLEKMVEKQKITISLNREMLKNSGSFNNMGDNFMKTLPMGLSLETEANKQRFAQLAVEANTKSEKFLNAPIVSWESNYSEGNRESNNENNRPKQLIVHTEKVYDLDDNADARQPVTTDRNSLKVKQQPTVGSPIDDKSDDKFDDKSECSGGSDVFSDITENIRVNRRSVSSFAPPPLSQTKSDSSEDTSSPSSLAPIVDSSGNKIRTTKSMISRAKKNDQLKRLSFSKYDIYASAKKSSALTVVTVLEEEAPSLDEQSAAVSTLWDESTDAVKEEEEDDQSQEKDKSVTASTDESADLIINDLFKWMHASADKLAASALNGDPDSLKLMRGLMDGIKFWEESQFVIASAIIGELENGSKEVPELVAQLSKMIETKQASPVTTPLIVSQIKQKFNTILKFHDRLSSKDTNEDSIRKHKDRFVDSGMQTLHGSIPLQRVSDQELQSMAKTDRTLSLLRTSSSSSAVTTAVSSMDSTAAAAGEQHLGYTYALFSEVDFEILPGVQLVSARRVKESIVEQYKKKSRKNKSYERQQLHMNSWVTETNIRYCARSAGTPATIYNSANLKLAPVYLNAPTVTGYDAVVFPNILSLLPGINLITGEKYSHPNVSLPEDVLMLQVQVSNDQPLSLPPGLMEVHLSPSIKLTSTLEEFMRSSRSIPLGHELVQLMNSSSSLALLPSDFEIAPGICLVPTPTSFDLPANLRLIKNPLNKPLPNNIHKLTSIIDEEDDVLAKLKLSECCYIVKRPVGVDMGPGMEVLRRPPGHPLPIGMTLLSADAYPDGLQLPEGLELIQLTPRYDFPSDCRINRQWKIWPRPIGMRLPAGVQIVYPDTSTAGGALPVGVAPVPLPPIPYGVKLPPNAQAVEILGSNSCCMQCLPPGCILGPGLVVLNAEKIAPSPQIGERVNSRNKRNSRAMNVLIVRRDPGATLPPLVERASSTDLPVGTLLAENIDVVRVSVRFELPAGVRIQAGAALGPGTQIAPGTELASFSGGHSLTYPMEVLEWPHGVRLASGIECVRRPPPGFYLPSGIEEVVSVATPSSLASTKASVEAPLPSFCMLIKLPRTVNYASCLTLAEQVTIGMEGGMRDVMSRLPLGMCLASRVSRNLPFPPGMSYVPPSSLDPKLTAALNEVNSKPPQSTDLAVAQDSADASIHNNNSSDSQKVQVKRNLCLEVVKLAPQYSFPAGTELIPGVFVQRRPVWLQTPPGVELVTRYANEKGDLLHFGPGIHRVSMRPEYVHTHDDDDGSIPSAAKEVSNARANAHHDIIISLEQVRSMPPARLPGNVELVQITEQCRQVHSWGPYLSGVEVVELTTLADGELLQPLPPYHFLIQRPLTKNSTPLPLGLKRGIAEEYSHWFRPPLLPSAEIIHIVPKFTVPMGINVMNTKVFTRSKPSRSRSTSDGDGARRTSSASSSAAVEVYSIPELSHGEFISPGFTVIARPFGSKAYAQLIESDPIYTKEPHVFIYAKDNNNDNIILPDTMTEDSRSAEAVELIFGEELPVALRPGSIIVSSSEENTTNMQQQPTPSPPSRVSDVIKFVRLSRGLPQPSIRFRPFRSSGSSLSSSLSMMIQRKGSSSIGNARDYKAPSTTVVFPRLIQLAKRLIGKTVDNFDQTNEYLTNTIIYRMMGQQKLPLLPEPAFTATAPSLSLHTEQPTATFKLDQDQPVEDGRKTVSAGGSIKRSTYSSTQTQTPSSSSSTSFQQEINESSMWRLQDLVDQLDSDNTRNKELVTNLTVENDAMKSKVSAMTTQIDELQKLCKYDGDLKALISRMNVKLAEKDLELGVLKSTGHLATARLANQVDVLNSQVAAFQEFNAMMSNSEIGSISSSGSEELRKEREEERLFDLFDEVHDYYQDRFASMVHTLSTLFTDCILKSVSDFENTLLTWSTKMMESAQVNSLLPSSRPIGSSSNSFIVPAAPLPSEPGLPDLSDEDLSILTDDNSSSVNTYLRYRPQDLTRDVHGKLVSVDAAFPLDIKRLYRADVTPVLAEPSKNIGLAKRSELNTPIVHVGAPSAIAYHQTSSSKPGSAEKKKTSVRSINYMKLPHIIGSSSNSSSSAVDEWGHSSSLVSKELSAHRLSEFLLKDPQVKRLKTELETSAHNLPKFARVDVGLQMDKLFNDVEPYLSKFILDSKATTTTTAITAEESKGNVTSKERRLKDNLSEAASAAVAHQNLQDQLGRITTNTKQFLTFLLQSHLNHTDASFRLLDVESEILHKNMDKASSRCEMMELMLHESRARFLNLTAGGGLTEEYMHSSLEALRSKVLDLQATIDIMQALHVHDDVSLLKALVSKAYDLSELEQGLRFSALMFKQKATKDEQIARTNNRALLHKRSSDVATSSFSNDPTGGGEEDDETNRLLRAEKGVISTGELKAMKNTARNWRKKSNLCYKKAETINSEIKEVHALIMDHLQMYQREAQNVIPFDMMEQILKANYRSTQQIRHSSSISFTSSSSDVSSMDIGKVKLSDDIVAAVAAATACISSDSTADLNSVSSASSGSSSVVSNVDALLPSTHSTATGSIAGNSLKSSTTPLSSLKMKPKNSDILAERMKAISQPTIKFGATGSLPPASAQSHLRFVGPLKRTVHK